MRGVIYTAIAGDYDELMDPVETISGVDYLCFSDSVSPRSRVWRHVPFDWHHGDPTRVARRVKVFAHHYLAEYSWSVWVDANIHITGDLRCFLDTHLATDTFLAFRHPRRSCIYMEARHCVVRQKDDPMLIEHQIERYELEGMPRDYGLHETNVLLRDHRDTRLRDLMGQWWREIENGSRRDQLSLSVVLWRNGVKPRFFFDGARLLDELPYFRRVEHRHELTDPTS